MGKTIGVVFALKDKFSPAIIGIIQRFGMAVFGAKRIYSIIKTGRGALCNLGGILESAIEDCNTYDVGMSEKNFSDNMRQLVSLGETNIIKTDKTVNINTTINKPMVAVEGDTQSFTTNRVILHNRLKQVFNSIGINEVRGKTPLIQNMVSEVSNRFTKIKNSCASVIKRYDDVVGVYQYKNLVNKNKTGNSRILLTQDSTFKRNALGTSYFGGGTTLVGEYGPELVNLPRGSQVLSNNHTQQAMSGDRNVTVNLNVAGNVLGNREFFDEMMRMMAKELRTVMPQY